jgi:hypothetical protein
VQPTEEVVSVSLTPCPGGALAMIATSLHGYLYFVASASAQSGPATVSEFGGVDCAVLVSSYKWRATAAAVAVLDDCVIALGSSSVVEVSGQGQSAASHSPRV